MKIQITFFFMMFMATIASADLLKDLPLRSKIIFGKEDFLNFDKGIASLEKTGCYLLSDMVDSPSTAGRTLDLIKVQVKIDTRLVKQPEVGYEYRFLEQGRLSNMKMICHQEVSIQELREVLAGRGLLWEAPKDFLQSSANDILEYPVGTIFRVERATVIPRTARESGIYIGKECLVRSEQATENLVLRAGSIFVLKKAPYMRASRTLELHDVADGTEILIQCHVATRQIDLGAQASFFLIVPSPESESMVATGSIPKSGLESSKNYILTKLPLRSRIAFGKENLNDSTEGKQALASVGCQFSAFERRSTVGLELDYVTIRPKSKSDLTDQNSGTYEYRFLEGSKLSSVILTCLESVTLNDLKSALQAFARIWEAPVPENSNRSVLEYPIGTIIKISRPTTLDNQWRPYWGPYAVILFEKNVGCYLAAPTYTKAPFLLRAGQIFRLGQEPEVYQEDRQIYEKLQFFDVSTSEFVYIYCRGSVTKALLESKSGSFEIVSDPAN